MLWNELKYLNLLQNRLEFKVVRNNPKIVNFRCIVCGDSQHKKSKKRAYIIEKDASLYFYCHNCGTSEPFWLFLRDRFPIYYRDYKLDNLKKNEKKNEEPVFKTTTQFKKKENLGIVLTECQDCSAIDYVKKRKIREHFWPSLYFCSNLKDITSQYEKYKDVDISDPCLLIPFFNKERDYSYISARSIEDNNFFRYINLQIDDMLPKLWGLEYVDWSQPVSVFEGALDAMSVSNGLAMAGLAGETDTLLQHTHKKNICFVFDNEIHCNSNVFKHVKNRITQGYCVFIPDNRFRSKDVNQSIMNEEFTFDEINDYIAERSFHSLEASLELSKLLKTKKGKLC